MMRVILQAIGCVLERSECLNATILPRNQPISQLYKNLVFFEPDLSRKWCGSTAPPASVTK